MNLHKSKFLLISILSVLLIILTSSVVFGAKVDKIIKSIQNKYKSTKKIRIDFKQTSHFSLTGTTTEIAGTWQMEGRDRFRLDSEDMTLVNNGSTVWKYNKLENQVLIDHAKKSEQDVMFNNLLYEIQDHYFGQLLEEHRDGRTKIYLIKLTPKPSEQDFITSIKLWVKDKTWEISKLVSTDYNGNETEYVIENIEFNPIFGNNLFEFIPPESIQVIDLRF